MVDHIWEVADEMMARSDEFRQFLRELKADPIRRESDQNDEEA